MNPLLCDMEQSDRSRRRRASVRSCYGCSSLGKDGEHTDTPDGATGPWTWWYECHGTVGAENLKSFPFLKTKCSAWRPSK